MSVRALLLASRCVPRALKVTALITGVLFGLAGGLSVAATVMASDVQNAFDRLAVAGEDLLPALGADAGGLGGREEVAQKAVE